MTVGDCIDGRSLVLRKGRKYALIVILVFLFAYLFLLSTEVRFARRIDRYVGPKGLSWHYRIDPGGTAMAQRWDEEEAARIEREYGR